MIISEFITVAVRRSLTVAERRKKEDDRNRLPFTDVNRHECSLYSLTIF